MSTRGGRGIGARRLVAALGLLVIVSCGPAGDARLPDIVLITIDTLRADRLGCYGYYRETSPEIDRFAESAILFENSLTHMATTLPSHVSLMTSMHPMSHGIRGNLHSFQKPLDPDSGVRTLAQLLKEQGYETAAFVSATPVKRATGIAAGFDTFLEPDGIERKAEVTIDLALGFLETEREVPFFLWVHLFDPHDSYQPPAPYDSLFATDSTQIEYLKANAFTLWEHPQIQRVNNLYDGEIRYTDSELGRLFRFLDARGAKERTAIVLAADHGEGLGQHDWVPHDQIYQEQIRVPLLMRLPGKEPGTRRGQLAGLVDVVPTLVDALVLPIPEESRTQFEGRSLFSDGERDFVFTERVAGREGKVGPGEMYSLTTNDWKYFLATDEEDRLYDLRRDRLETRNRIAEEPEVAEELRERILSILGSSPEPGRPGEAELPAEHVEQLRGLGYVD